jgi:hypothetical protein
LGSKEKKPKEVTTSKLFDKKGSSELMKWVPMPRAMICLNIACHNSLYKVELMSIMRHNFIHFLLHNPMVKDFCPQ